MESILSVDPEALVNPSSIDDYRKEMQILETHFKYEVQVVQILDQREVA